MRLFGIFWAAFMVGAVSQGPAQPAPFMAPPAGESVLQPKLGCGELRGLTGFAFSIETAVLVPAAGDLPEYCLVKGQIQPEIRFGVSLPTRWNRRFLMTGNGGYAGESIDSGQVVNLRNQAARRGFVMASSNTGHDAGTEPLGSFAVNRQKLLDYAFRSLKVTADAGKQIATAFYGARPSRSYFEGCSTGGRQALMIAQRFPDEFDGIVAGAPVLNFTGTMIGYLARMQALVKAPIPYAKVAPLGSRIYKLCDGKDGLEDGLIDDPRRCDFRPARDLTKCAEGASGAECFTTGEIGTLEVIYGDVQSQGKKVFPGWPVGAEVAGPSGRPGWDNWIVTEKGQPTVSQLFAESFFRYLAFPEKNPALDVVSLDMDKTLPRLDWIHSVLDANEPDLSAFQKRGGKLFMYYGWADPALNAQMGVDYYESVVARMGAGVTSFFRLFMVPGMFHCGGGVGCATFDKLGPTVDWVERKIAPDRIVGSQMAAGKVIRTRPHCPYPQVAVYQGSGSMDDAASFACRVR